MQQHDGVRARNPLGCLPFGKHRPALIGLAVARDTLANNPKMAATDRARGRGGPERAGATCFVLGHRALTAVSQ